VNKFDHVRQAPDDQPGHTCHAEGCAAHVKAAFFMCRRHWFMVPAELRNQIWLLYRPGQENDKRPSREYVEAMKQAIDAVARAEGRR